MSKQLFEDFGLFADEAPELPPKPAENATATNQQIPTEKAAQSVLERLAAIPMVPGATRMTPEENVGIEALPIALLHQLNACTLYLSVGTSKAIIAFSTSRKAYALLMQARIPCFVGSEFRAVAYAAQNDRLWSKDFMRIVNKKAKEPTWVLSELFATGVVYNLNKLSWSIGETLTRIHAELVAIEVYK